MKLKQHLIFGYLILPLILLSCSKEEAPVVQSPIGNCSEQVPLDSVQTSNALIGEWEWIFIDCFWWYPEQANGEKYQGLSVIFRADSTLEVVEKRQVTQTAHWEIVDGYNGFLALEVDPPVEQLHGLIRRYCNDVVLFNDSYVDGCDNFFRRKEGSTAYGVRPLGD